MAESRSENLRTFMWWAGETCDGMSDLIVKAAVKDELSEHNVSADFYAALNEEVAEPFVFS